MQVLEMFLLWFWRLGGFVLSIRGPWTLPRLEIHQHTTHIFNYILYAYS